MIYFIRNIGSGRIKIGCADNPRARLKQLQTGSADKLILLKAIDGDEAAERSLHEQFAHCRLDGEWFLPEPDLLEFIKGKDYRLLEGKFFHSFEKDRLKWQGYVVGQPAEGYYLVQLFEWVLGEPSAQKLVRLEDMVWWEFYDSTEDWQAGFTRHTGQDGESPLAKIRKLRKASPKGR